MNGNIIIQFLCASGHYWTEDTIPDDVCCPDCDSYFVWYNCVDNTHQEEMGYLPMKLFLIAEAQFSTCDLGHQHQTSFAIYRKPTEEEAFQHQTFSIGDDIYFVNSAEGYKIRPAHLRTSYEKLIKDMNNHFA